MPLRWWSDQAHAQTPENTSVTSINNVTSQLPGTDVIAIYGGVCECESSDDDDDYFRANDPEPYLCEPEYTKDAGFGN